MGRLRRLALAVRQKYKWFIILVILPVVVFWVQNTLGDIVSYITESIGINSQSILRYVIDHLLLIMATLPFVAMLIILVREYYTILSEEGWEEVEFSTWNPYALINDVTGGIKLRNTKNSDLEQCLAELLGYESDDIVHPNALTGSRILQDSYLPGKLYWLVDLSLQTSTAIARGKEGYIAITYLPSEGKKKSVRHKSQYQIQTLTAVIPGLERGFVDVRISAKVNGKSLSPIIKRVRIEPEGMIVRVTRVIDSRKKHIRT